MSGGRYIRHAGGGYTHESPTRTPSRAEARKQAAPAPPRRSGAARAGPRRSGAARAGPRRSGAARAGEAVEGLYLPADRPTDDGEALRAVNDAIAAVLADISAGRTPAEARTQDGRPRTSALEAVLGWSVTAEDRDRAWAAFKAPPRRWTPPAVDTDLQTEE